MRTVRSGPLALLCLLAACGAPDSEVEWVDVGDLEQGLGVTCVGTQDCTGGTSVYASTYRVGAGPTSAGELVQTFKATSTLAPARVFLVARSLRAIPAGRDPLLHAEVYGPITTPVSSIDFDALTPVLAGSTHVNALVPNVQTSIVLTSTGPLEAEATYAVRIRADGTGQGTETVLVGIGAITTSTYADGSAFRATRRSSTPWGTLGPVRHQAAGPWDVALAMSGALGSPCDAPAECSAGLSCVSGTCANPITISPATVTVGIAGQQAFSATGGTAPYTYSVVSGGGSFSGATYTAPGSAGSAVVRVTDAALHTADAAVTIAAPTVILLTAFGSNVWTVPFDWNSNHNSVEVIGAGASGGGNQGNTGNGGGGGGAYAKRSNLSFLPGQTLPYRIAFGGQATTDVNGLGTDYTWFNTNDYQGVPVPNVVAAEGGKPNNGRTGGAGGRASTSCGDVTFSGGNGGSATSNSFDAGGGGGAAGPGGNGANGGNGSGGAGGGGGGGGAGGGSNGANSSSGGAGGHNAAGTGGGSGYLNSPHRGVAGTAGGGGQGGQPSVQTIGGAGGAGAGYVATSDGAVAGPGGGGGAGNSNAGGTGGLYGGGGGGAGGGGSGFFSGAGGQGLIVITYLPQ